MNTQTLSPGSSYVENLKLRIFGHYLLNQIPDGEGMREALESLVDIIQVNLAIARYQHRNRPETALREPGPTRARLGDQFVRPAFPIPDE